MSPERGRFITADPTVQRPFDPQDLNRYAYARNNPIRFTDPTGFGFFTKLFAIIGAAIGSAIPGVGPFLGAVIGGTIGGALGGTIDAAIAKQNLGRGAIQGAITGASIGARDGAFGSSSDGSGGGDGGLSSAFSPEPHPGYIYIDASTVSTSTWDKITGIVAQGAGFTFGVMKAIVSNVATWENTAYASTRILLPLPGAGGLNPDRELSRFKEKSQSKESPELVTLYHYGYLKNAAAIRTNGIHAFGTPGGDAYATRDFYTSGRQAQQRLALPHQELPDARYALYVDLSKTSHVDLGVVPRSVNPPREGGGTQVYFPEGVPAEAVGEVERISR